eukprot:CAMPEP_0184493922 /NCGR_PEP_ID=MMETSP0113_2-20130426/27316_1 /TAXON_ID=91329 /ORGANISM="Norrisiella sphaerica, Strain BC52" /LENGTH=483 /DNA_ID=CAMNT_0026879411 /DNA_START=162 /DNA_END=1610 /DNA_ORIENTATION=-
MRKRAFSTTGAHKKGLLLEAYETLVTVEGLERNERQIELLKELEGVYHLLAQGGSEKSNYKNKKITKISAPRNSTRTGAMGEIGEGKATNDDGDGRHTQTRISSLPGDADTKGFYIFGGVGSGKTFCMDLFYKQTPSMIRKKRWHFHEFMLETHQRLHQIKQMSGERVSNPLVTVGRQIAQESGRLLCFDEFQVTDIGDAMILKLLLETIFDEGTFIVFTSNRPPRDLYLNGLNRHLFLPSITMIEEHTRVFGLDHDVDYRAVRQSTSGECGDLFIHGTCAATAEREALSWLKRFVREYHSEKDAPIGTAEVHVAMGRTLPVLTAVADAACAVTFEELCNKERSSHDFLALAKAFNGIVLTGVPKMTQMSPDALRRFITLIDAMYENRVMLAIQSAVPTLKELIASDTISETSSDGSRVSPNEAHVATFGGSSGRSATMIGNTEWSATGRVSASLAGTSGIEEAEFARARAASRLQEMSSMDW